MKLDNVTIIKKVKIMGEEVEIKNTIETAKKDYIIKTALDESLANGGLPSRLLFEATLHTLIVYLYTNIEITRDISEDDSAASAIDLGVLETYDLLRQNDIFPKVLENMDEAEFRNLIEYADNAFKDFTEYYKTGGALATSAIASLQNITKTKDTKASNKLK